MSPEQRNKLIRRLCLFAPILSAASIALVALTPLRGLSLRMAQTISPPLAAFLSAAPALGWCLLTLGCSAVTALDLLRVRRESCGTTAFVMLALFGTLLVFFTHVLVTSVIVVAGCVIATRGRGF